MTTIHYAFMEEVEGVYTTPPEVRQNYFGLFDRRFPSKEEAVDFFNDYFSDVGEEECPVWDLVKITTEPA